MRRRGVAPNSETFGLGTRGRVRAAGGVGIAEEPKRIPELFGGVAGGVTLRTGRDHHIEAVAVRDDVDEMAELALGAVINDGLVPFAIGDGLRAFLADA